MELLYSRALDMNGAAEYSDEDGENSIYKQKYERALKELEFTKRRLQQQHEDDMEQLIGLKKQLEKKVSCFLIYECNVCRKQDPSGKKLVIHFNIMGPLPRIFMKNIPYSPLDFQPMFSLMEWSTQGRR